MHNMNHHRTSGCMAPRFLSEGANFLNPAAMVAVSTLNEMYESGDENSCSSILIFYMNFTFKIYHFQQKP